MFHSQYKNIPGEMQALPQWVLWRYVMKDERQTKIPFSVNDQYASVTDPKTWCSFETALAAAHRFDGIGFVLSQLDPFTIIDLDNKPHAPCTPEQLDRHGKIYHSFESYTERSVSGTGVHIIVKGEVPEGTHRDNVEVYSSARFMVCTGDVIRQAEVVNCQAMLDVLYSEMKPTETTSLVDVEGIMDDGQLLDMAMRAVNADKFNSLCRGEMTDYPSQSEADFALLSIIAYYTRDNEQVRRIFRMTALGKREKAQRNKYLNDALEKIRAKQPAPVDIDAMAANAEALVASMQKNIPPATAFHGYGPREQTDEQIEQAQTATLPGITLPPGLIGDLAQYFYQTAIRPVSEIALAAAIALVSGVCGRAYNVSGTGLNQYIILLARTGAGKEGAAMGIENLVTAVRPQLPMIDQFLGPAAFASGQALVKVLNEKPCFVSVLGEFGLTLQQLSDARANSAQIMLRRVLLDLYAKSGWNRTLRSSVYSDTEKNTAMIQAPNVTILGESTPETFFDGLDASHIAEGLIPRFSVIEYTGPRPARNRNSNVPPPADLVQRFADLCAAAITTSNNNVCCHVQFDGHSQKMMDDFDTRADEIMNESKVEVEMQVWNRAHLKALKLSALLAVGVNAHQPVVTQPLAQWAIDFVLNDCSIMTKRFKDGDVGQGDSKQFHDLQRAIEAFFHLKAELLDSYGVSSKMHKDKVIPYRYLIRRTSGLSSFRNDKQGATNSLRRTIQALIDSGMIVELPGVKLMEKYQFSGAAYGIGCHWNK